MQSILDQLNFSARGKEGKFVVFQYQEGWGLGKNGNWNCWRPSKEIACRALAAWGVITGQRRWCSKPSSQTRSKTSSQSSLSLAPKEVCMRNPAQAPGMEFWSMSDFFVAAHEKEKRRRKRRRRRRKTIRKDWIRWMDRWIDG